MSNIMYVGYEKEILFAQIRRTLQLCMMAESTMVGQVHSQELKGLQCWGWPVDRRAR